MRLFRSLLAMMIAASLLSCSEDPSSSNNNNGTQNPTVAKFIGSCGLNMGPFYYEPGKKVDSLTADVPLKLLANHTTNERYTVIELEVDQREGIAQIPLASGNGDCGAITTVKLFVPTDSTGTYPWVPGSDSSTAELEVNWCQGEVTIDKMIQGSTTITSNEKRIGSILGREIIGKFSGVLENAEGKRIAIDGSFDFRCFE